MSDVRVHVPRHRPLCPFCRAAVEGGDVWLCPGCYAPHHAECQREHPGCATCAHSRTRARALTIRATPWRLLAPSDLERLGRLMRMLLFVGSFGAAATLQLLAILLVLRATGWTA